MTFKRAGKAIHSVEQLAVLTLDHSLLHDGSEQGLLRAPDAVQHLDTEFVSAQFSDLEVRGARVPLSLARLVSAFRPISVTAR